MKKNRKLLTLEKRLFEAIYKWGGYGVVVNHKAPAYKMMLKKMYTIAYDEGWRECDLWIQANRNSTYE